MLNASIFEEHNYELLNALNSKDKIIKLNIPAGKSDDELRKLREFIKEISNQKGNINVEMINGENKKVLPMYIDERIFSKLQELVGKENVEISDMD